MLLMVNTAVHAGDCDDDDDDDDDDADDDDNDDDGWMDGRTYYLPIFQEFMR